MAAASRRSDGSRGGGLLPCGGTLNRYHRQITARLYCHTVCLCLAVDPGEVFFRSARIDHHTEPPLLHEVGNQVIDHPAVFIEHTAVECFAGFFETRHIIGQQMPEELLDPIP